MLEESVENGEAYDRRSIPGADDLAPFFQIGVKLNLDREDLDVDLVHLRFNEVEQVRVVHLAPRASKAREQVVDLTETIERADLGYLKNRTVTVIGFADEFLR